MANVLTYKQTGRWCCCLLVLLFCELSFAQTSHRLIIRAVDKDSTFSQKLGFKTAFPSKVHSDEYVSRLPALLQAKGYIASSLDSVTDYQNHTKISVYFGNEFQLGNLNIPDEHLPIIHQVTDVLHSGKKVTFYQFNQFREKLLDYYENNGYPFARINLENVTIDDQLVNAQIFIEKGIFYKVDSIRLFGPAKISRNFLYKYLAIERGSAYSQHKLSLINQRILELPYLQQVQPWEVLMLNTGSIVNLYLEPKKSNQVNVLAGFLPDNQQLGGGKLLFTIDANLKLKNAFGTGETLGILWQQIQPKSPRLHLQYQQPYIFKSPLELDFSFDLFKKDSLFLNINSGFGLRYVFSSENSAKLSLQTQRTNVLDVDTIFIKNYRQLPDIADVSSISIGVDYEYNNTNFRLSPRKGSELLISTSIGSKAVRKNNTILQLKDPAFNYNLLYDSIKLKAYQVRFKLIAARYFMVGRQSVLKTGINTAIYQSQNYFRNEMFQIGGYRTLRGFDEESIYANKYFVGTIEYRLMLSLNSYFFGFTDLGWSGNRRFSTTAKNRYLGMGLGLAVESKGSIFNISYALGKRDDLRFNIREAKIHLGYVSVF